MRSLIIAAAAILAVAAPGIASANTGGAVGVTLASLDDDNDSDKEGVWGINGIVLSEIAPGWTLQGQGHSYDMDHGDHGHAFSQVEVGLNYQINEAVAVGGHIGQINDDGDAHLTYGVSARVNTSLHDISIAAGVTGTDDINGDDDSFSNVVVTVGMPLFDIAHVGIYGSWSDFDSSDVESFGVVGDVMIPGSRFGVGAFYQTSDYDSGDADAFGIRLNYNFGDDMMRGKQPGSEHLLYDSIVAF